MVTVRTSCWSITHLCTLLTWHIHSLHLHVKSVHAMKASMGTKVTVPHVLNLGTRWRWVINFTFRPLYPRKRRAGPIHYEVGWAPETVWTCLRRKNLLPLEGFEPGTHHLSLLSGLRNYPSGRGAAILTKLRAGQPRHRGTIPDRTNRFLSSPKRPARLWSPHSMLFCGHEGLFLWGKGKLTTHLHLLPWLRMSGARPLLNKHAFTAFEKPTFALYRQT